METTIKCLEDAVRSQYYISQRDNCINPGNTCNCTSLANCLMYSGWSSYFDTWNPIGNDKYSSEGDSTYTSYNQEQEDFAKKWKSNTDFPFNGENDKRLSDKLTYYLLTSQTIRDKYKTSWWFKGWEAKFNEQWQNKKNTFCFGNANIGRRWPGDVYPPNEITEVLAGTVNSLFKEFGINSSVKYYSDAVGYGIKKEQLIEALEARKPVLASVKFGTLGHIIMLSGIETKIDSSGVKKATKIYVDDPYGRFDLKTLQYTKNEPFVKGKSSKTIKNSGNLNEFKKHYPGFNVEYNFDDLFGVMKDHQNEKRVIVFEINPNFKPVEPRP